MKKGITLFQVNYEIREEVKILVTILNLVKCHFIIKNDWRALTYILQKLQLDMLRNLNNDDATQFTIAVIYSTQKWLAREESKIFNQDETDLFTQDVMKAVDLTKVDEQTKIWCID
jgi:hypothetical protein